MLPASSRRRPVSLTLAIGALFAAMSAAWAGPPAVSIAVAADASSDIPGVPLPGTVAAGRLGGAIYDVVYSLNVAPGYVIVASLTGAAGTDFDIYLFDATAGTVLSNTGLLTKSTGPTSTEAISWPSQFGGTYYIDLNGATDVEGDYRLTVQAVPDPTPPIVSITLASGRPSTNQATVAVTLNATDDLSGVTQMAFSADGLTFDGWQPFQQATTWAFPAGDGSRALWVKVRNGVGLESNPATDSVTIDTVSPRVTAVDPLPGSTVAGLRPRFSVVFDEPMAPASWIDVGLIVQSPTGALVPGAFTYDVATRTGGFVPSFTLQPGASYIVAVANVEDVAGNRVISPGSWSITAVTPTSLAATADPRVVLLGGSTRLAVALSGPPLPAALEVLRTTGSGVFEPLTGLLTEDGHGSLVVAPASNTTYRFSYGGTFGVASAQVDVPVLVRRSVVLAGRDSTVVSRARVGATVKLTAAINPASAGVSVSFRLYRFDPARRAWIYAGSRGRNTDAAGRASYTWTPPSPGSWYWRASVASTAEFANNISAVYRWSVTR